MSLGTVELEIGTVIRSYRDDTTPPKLKYWIVVGISSDGVSLASVFINTRIHDFILRNPVLLDAQYKIEIGTRTILDYDSYVDCSQVKEKGRAEIGTILNRNPHYIVGTLYPEEIDDVLSLIRQCPTISQRIKDRYQFR